MRAFLPAIVAALSSSALFAQTTPTPARGNDKVRCKSHIETGTLAKATKECHTPAEWQKMANKERSSAGYYRQTMNSSRGGN